MHNLSPEARRLFELARAQDEPSPAALARIERALSGRLAAGAATFVSGSAWALWAKIIPPSALKVGIIFGAIAGTSATGLWLYRTHQGAPRATVPESVRPKPRLLERLDTAASPTSSVVSSQSDAEPMPKVRTPAVSRSLRAPDPSTESLTRPDRLLEETRGLREAQQALRSGNAVRALSLLEDQERVFGAGVLQQERAAARVLALCQAGQVDGARSEAIAFERRWPKSPMLARVRSSCR